MSAGACAKKRLCNPPVKAAVESADGIVDLLDRAMRDGVMTDGMGDALIYEFTDSDERYCAEQKEIALRAIDALDRAEASPTRGRR
jgi:hypothetical protein